MPNSDASEDGFLTTQPEGVRPKPPPSTVSDLLGDTGARIGRYEIRRILGEGAFGRVFLAFDPDLKRQVVIKVPKPDGFTPDLRERFIREAQATATIHHPNVCAVYDVGVGDPPYIVMHYLAGTTLAAYLEGGKTFPPVQAVKLAEKLALGISAAHEKSVIHRDLKPQNVLFDPTRQLVLITDFGLARMDNQVNLTSAGAVFGTPLYMSPEQARGKQDEVGPLSDVYSLGVLLYRMLTGAVPFPGDEGVFEVLRRHCEVDPVPPSVALRGLDPRLDGLCLKAMAKKPTDRFPSAKVFAEALAEYGRSGGSFPLPPLAPSGPRTAGPSSQSAPPTVPLIPPATAPITLDARRPVAPAPAAPPSARKPVAPMPTSQRQPASPPTNPPRPPSTGGGRTPTLPPPPPPTAPTSRRQPTPLFERQPEPLPLDDEPELSPPSGSNRQKVFVGAGLLLVAGALLAAVFIFKPGKTDPTTPTPPGAGDGTAGGTTGGTPGGTTGGPTVPTGVVLACEGSSFVDPMMQRWAALYHPKAGVTIKYTKSGSSAGVRELISRRVLMGGTDAYLTDAQLLEAEAAGGPVVHVPLVMGAVVATYNLPGVTQPLRFPGKVLADIYLGKITRWNDDVIANNNPGVKLPATPITVVRRSDGSGTTFIWTDYLSKVSGEWKVGPGVGNAVKWPIGVPADKNDGVAREVSKTVGAIGYVELTFALARNLPAALVENREGEFVVPSLKSVTAAATGQLKDIPADLRYTLTDAPGRESYPISGTAWAVVYKKQSGEAGRELVNFLKWAVHDGQAHVTELKYAPLPPELVEKIDAALATITVGP